MKNGAFGEEVLCLRIQVSRSRTEVCFLLAFLSYTVIVTSGVQHDADVKYMSIARCIQVK